MDHWTRRMTKWVGVPVFVTYTGAVHIWTITITYAGGGKGEAVWAALTPMWSWFRLAYTASLVLWSVSMAGGNELGGT